MQVPVAHMGIQGEHRRRSRTCCQLSLRPPAALFTSASGSLSMFSAWELTDTQAQHQYIQLPLPAREGMVRRQFCRKTRKIEVQIQRE